VSRKDVEPLNLMSPERKMLIMQRDSPQLPFLK